jgi:hypothetical protein
MSNSSNNGNIPSEFRNIPNWLLWRYKINDKSKEVKMPRQANGWKAMSNNPETWTTFEKVVKASDGYDGIGWCVPLSGQRYCGVDVDDAVDPDTKELMRWDGSKVQPADVIALNSYTEYTPSGFGFRTLVKIDGNLEGGNRFAVGERNEETGKIPGVEMYSAGRFFTFTGNQVPGTPDTVEDRSGEIRKIQADLIAQKPTKDKKEKKEKARQHSVDEVIARFATFRLSTMNVPLPEYLFDPFIVRNGITAITGAAESGKSTSVNWMLHQVANKLPDDVVVIYCDADNPASIAKARSARVRGKLEDRTVYWAGFCTDAEGKTLPPVRGGEKRHHFGRCRAEPMEPVRRAHWR